MRVFQIIAFLAFILSSCVYLSVRLYQIAPFNQTWKIVFISVVILLFLAFVLSFLIGNKLPVNVTKVLYRVGSAWFFICIYLLIAFLLIDIIRLTHLVNIDQYVFNNKYFFITLCSVITIVMSIGYFKYQNKHRENIDLTFSENANNKMKIVAVSDLHLGYGIGNKELKKWVDLINKETPDVVVIAGDLIDNSIRPVLNDKMYEQLKRVNAKHGVYMILGNHEYISGIKECENFAQLANVTILKDSVVKLDDLYLVGRDDITNNSRKKLEELLSPLDRTKPVILLDHQPSHLEDAMNNNVFLQISGHTHRGQIWPISWITDKIFENSYGYYKKDNTNYYVTSGLGIWAGKFRIGSKSEYVVINLEY